jgi:uncharacterized protein with ParB-like and HNH nuclease domain
MEQAYTIQYILNNDSYIIPRYQRNYAWGKAEISQLIKDIDEFFNDTENKAYYLGSLVCFKRENGTFELLDGQQRYTTLTLLNLVLKNWKTEIKDTVSETNLKFDSRKKSQQYVESLYKVKQEDFNGKINDLNVVGTGNFKDAIEIIQEELEELRDKDVSKFADNFYNKVYLFRIEVPEDTDLNHYFEIMNSRGEQLEKHEIVKALLMGNKEKMGNTEDQNKFAAIWDACSDMSDYVYSNFDEKNRQNIFDDKGNLKTGNFSEISINNDSATDKNDLLSLLEILDKNELPTEFSKEEKYSKDKYKSIIDFPNFLLQVLKIRHSEVPLDDKNLVKHFEPYLNEPVEFITDLLKYRTLFDLYVIKQDLSDADESKQNWGIRKLNTDFKSTIKTFENDDELVKLQVMLYYSNSTNTYNNWLQEILKYDKLSNIADYTTKILEIAKNRFNKDRLSYPEISIFNLYFIDFLLWKMYDTEIKGDKVIAKPTDDTDSNYIIDLLKWKISNKKDLFNSFKFRQLNSKEHLAAQSNPSSANISPEELNGIGNLCLISTSENSAGNKENPTDKKKRFQGKNSSLKRIIMFESFEDDKWGEKQIEKHRKEIMVLIDWYIK